MTRADQAPNEQEGDTMTVETATARRAPIHPSFQQREVASRTNSEVEFVGNNYVTVSIPDLRGRQVTGEVDDKKFRFDGAQEPMFARKISNEPEVRFDTDAAVPIESSVRGSDVGAVGAGVSSLAAIKDSIERSFQGGDVDQYNREVELERLAEQLAEKAFESEASDDVGSVVTKPRVAKVCLKKFDVADLKISPITASIRDLPRKDGCTIVAFASTEGNEHLESVLIGTGKELGDDPGRRVLIIDSDFGNNRLTKSLKSENSKGLSELTRSGTDLQSLLAETSVESVEFLAAGKRRIQKTQQCETVIKTIVPKLADQFEYILVNVGDAHEKAARIWSKYTNGSYLLVSMQNSNHEIAKSAVSQLNAFGARLIGCIASDADSTG